MELLASVKQQISDNGDTREFETSFGTVTTQYKWYWSTPKVFIEEQADGSFVHRVEEWQWLSEAELAFELGVFR